MIAHALVDNRIAASLANNQIGPLDDDDRHEKGRVASVFQLFTGIVSLEIEPKRDQVKSQSNYYRLRLGYVTPLSINNHLPILACKNLRDH